MTIQKYEAPQAIDLRQYTPDRFNVLSLTQEVCAISPFHRPRLSIVQIDADPSKRDVYESTFCRRDDRNPENSEVALGKNAILKLADAAGIVWDSSQRIDDRKDPGYVEWQVWGHLTGPDGSIKRVFGTKAVDTRPGGSVEAELRKMVASKMRSWNGKPAQIKTQAEADEWVAKELRAARGNALANAETKAMLRAVRAALKLRPTYTRAELAKPFVVPHLDFVPDYSDPEIRRMAMGSALQAQFQLYGQLPAHQVPTSAPPVHVVDAEGVVAEAFQGPDEDDIPETPLPQHSPVTGEVVNDDIDPVHDVLLVIGQADALQLSRMVTDLNRDKARYGDDFARIRQAVLARRQQLEGGARG